MEHKKLDSSAKQDVKYCIPLWLRDEQIALSIKRIKARIQPVKEKRSEAIAVVGFGPSLIDTWEQLIQFKYIISCSGAHKFLIERGIIPTWHVEVDPREHKTKLIGEPHKDVEYLISSTCHPKVFDHLEGFNVKLWHVFATEEESLRVLPRGEWALTGGASVGLRAMTIARFFGFTDLHIFGMDGNYKESTHADKHPNSPPSYSLTEYEGVEYKTTPSMLECARQTFHELNQLRDVRANFYGEGLVQHMARHYIPEHVNSEGAILGFTKPDLISAGYAELNKRLHIDNLGYGVGGGRHSVAVMALAKSIQTQSILDYGCGKGYLAKAIPFPIWEYDPGVPGKEESPRPADLVVCTDVLEHIEPEYLHNVLSDIARCTKKITYMVISTRLAGKTLADGRNAHLIVKDKDWWKQKLRKYFQIGKVISGQSEIHIVAEPKIKKNKTALEKI